MKDIREELICFSEKQNAIRERFVKFFFERGHEHVPSSSLIPAGDSTLLFTNAGMVQFKDVFRGQETRSYKRAVTCQKCMRAGGKHNDLENVGYTKRHHTFFEMLGNFSFGDYFKREAIKYAWEFLTAELKINPAKLWVTVHQKDEDAARIWLEEIKIEKLRFSHCGDEDNFWAMGATGPCGYCSEIFYDYGEDLAGVAPGSGDTGDRFVEIWNLVFMEFERNEKGKLTKLPKPSIDTGMGLERITAAVTAEEMRQKLENERVKLNEEQKKFLNYFLQGDNYRAGYFGSILIDYWQDPQLFGGYENKDPKLEALFKIIADHARAIAFLIADGVMPSNEGRGYVLRHIIRRASYNATLLKKRNARELLIEFTEKWIRLMQSIYPELEENQNIIKETLGYEITKFEATLDDGVKYLEQEISKLKTKIISGGVAFHLYDTLGFPLELTKEIARERKLSIDEAGFAALMEKQRAASRAASKFGGAGERLNLDVAAIGTTEFLGYEQTACAARIVALYKNDGTQVEYLAGDDEGIMILNKTPFYAEAGGQVGDSGEIYALNGTQEFFVVSDTQKSGGIYLHYGKVKQGAAHRGMEVRAAINVERRQAMRCNHSAAHLLHRALHKVLGKHALQRGSMVDEARLRFDFTHPSALKREEIKEIEHEVNRHIRENLKVRVTEKTLAEAKADGALALFDEKYGDTVRVISMERKNHYGDAEIVSQELCAGTHVAYTGEIGVFKIVLETSVAAGVRRIEAVTAVSALEWFENYVENFDKVAKALKVNHEQVTGKIEQLLTANTKLERELGEWRSKAMAAKGQDLASAALDINGVKVLITVLREANIDARNLRNAVDQLKQKLGTAIVMLALVSDNKAQLVAGVTQDVVAKVNANELMQLVAAKIDGSGGGRADMAQGGGTNVGALEKALEEARGWVESKLK